jgi:uncharacterized protein (TIGR02246 family)
MELWELSARERIRDTLARYAHCADTGRFAELAALFTEDGVMEIDGRPPLQGRAAIETFLAGTKTNIAANLTRPLIRHHVSSIHIEVLGPDAATAASYFLAITERGPDHWGRYRDRFVRLGEQWLFQHRRVRPDGHAANSWVATRRESP